MKYRRIKHELINLSTFYVEVDGYLKSFACVNVEANDIELELPKLNTFNELNFLLKTKFTALPIKNAFKPICAECGKLIDPMKDTYYHGDIDYCEECGDDKLVRFPDNDKLYIPEDQDTGAEFYLDDSLSDLDFFELVSD